MPQLFCLYKVESDFFIYGTHSLYRGSVDQAGDFHSYAQVRLIRIILLLSPA